MQFYRCRICGETHLGVMAPDRCPFCGAAQEYLVPTEQFPEGLNDVQLTEPERNDLETAIEIERGNARFYRALGMRSDRPELASAYKRLASVEAEHCSLFCKLAGMVKPTDLMEPSSAQDDWCANIADSLTREKKAAAFYAEASGRATSQRIAEVLSAVSAVERDHIELDARAAAIAGCMRHRAPATRLKSAE